MGISEVDKWAIQAYDAIHNEQIKLTDASKEKMLNEVIYYPIVEFTN